MGAYGNDMKKFRGTDTVEPTPRGLRMFTRALSFGLLTAAVSLSVLGLGNAQTPAAPPAVPQAFRPSLGDLMTMIVQSRHAKLGLAGQEKNWVLAAHQLHELEESFEAVAQVWPMQGKTNIAELIVATTKGPMDAVSLAIKSADATSFAVAYGQLTATCNACHASTDHATIVIQVPKASSFPNQDFRPAKP
ncbi:hypothetical protein BH10PSE6_BH10PSE6_17600 [soil metagenome]